MDTNETPQPQTSISQMTPLPGESVQTSPDLLSFLLAQWEKQEYPTEQERKANALAPQMRGAAKLLQDFSEKYFQENPPVQSTTSDGRVVITLNDNQKVQVGGDVTEEFAPGTVLPSTAIKI